MELALIFKLFMVLGSLGLLCAIVAFILNSKLKKEYNNIVDNYQRLKMQYDIAVHAKEVAENEVNQLKTELRAERMASKTANVKSVEELPKTEKVAKPRGRKPKATK